MDRRTYLKTVGAVPALGVLRELRGNVEDESDLVKSTDDMTEVEQSPTAFRVSLVKDIEVNGFPVEDRVLAEFGPVGRLVSIPESSVTRIFDRAGRLLSVDDPIDFNVEGETETIEGFAVVSPHDDTVWFTGGFDYGRRDLDAVSWLTLEGVRLEGTTGGSTGLKSR